MEDQPADFSQIFDAAWTGEGGGSEASDTAPGAPSEPSPESAEPTADAPVSAPKSDTKARSKKAAAKAAPTTAEQPEEGTSAPTAPEDSPDAQKVREYAAGRLTTEEQALLAGLPDDAQMIVRQVLARQDAAHNKRSQEIASVRRDYAALNDVLELNRADWRKNGLTDQQALQNLLAVEQSFARDPSGTLKWLANQYGVSSPEQGNGSANTASQEVSAQQEFDSEAIRRLVQEQTQQALRPIMARQQEEQLNQMEQLRLKFQENHPYKDFLPLVESQVPAFIQLERRTNPNATPMELLEAATTMALWANEQTKAVMLDAALKEQREKLLGAAQGRVSAARKASSSVTGAPAPNIRRNGPLDLDEIIKSALSEQGI